ncbi:MAG: OB-fold nucleic acid binding domain-containing protein [Thermoplasmata archaeon]
MNVDTLYELVKDIISYDNFLSQIEMRKKVFNNLLNEEAIAYLIVDELGKNPGNFTKISELIDGVNVSLKVKVEKVYDTEIVKSKKNKDYRIRKLNVSDDSGNIDLVLWNEEIDNYSWIREGDQILIRNCYVKLNNNNLQLVLGKWGLITKI